MKRYLIWLPAAALGWWLAVSISHEPGQIQIGDSFIAAATKSTYFKFDLTGKKQFGTYRLMALSPTTGRLRQMGFAFSAAVLSESDYSRFEAVRAQGGCPASFLQGHAINLLLVIPDEALRRRLARADIAPGNLIKLNGQVLRFAMGEIDKVPLKSLSLDGAIALLVNEAELSGTPARV